jgi:PAS domain S-box-containing protein
MRQVKPVPDAVPDVALDVRLLADVVEHSPLGMSLTPVDPAVEVRLSMRSVHVNQALADMLGYSRHELLTAANQGALTHPKDRSADAAHVQQLIDYGGSAEQWEKRYLHHDGHVVWARVSASVIRAAEGTPMWLIAQVEDITQRRRAEQELAAAQQQLVEEQRRTAEQLQEALDNRVVIEQAKGFVAATNGIGVDAAFTRLRDYARAHNATVREVAAAVVDLGLRP